MCVVDGASTALGEARGAARLIVASHSGFGGASLALWGWMCTRLQTRKPVLPIAKKRRRDANALQTPRQSKMILTNCAACAAPLAHDAPRCVRCNMELSHNRFRAIWMMHFYGHQGYREHLRTAVKGLIALSARLVRVRGETCEVCQKACATLRSALDTQLDWSLDDLELDASEQAIIETVLSVRPRR